MKPTKQRPLGNGYIPIGTLRFFKRRSVPASRPDSPDLALPVQQQEDMRCLGSSCFAKGFVRVFLSSLGFCQVFSKVFPKTLDLLNGGRFRGEFFWMVFIAANASKWGFGAGGDFAFELPIGWGL